MKVKFENGFVTEIKDEIAKKMVKKGECKQVKGPGRPAKSEEVKDGE